MKIELYGMTAINPIHFPDELEIRVLPLSPDDDRWLGGSFSMKPYRSWEWVRLHHPVPGYQFDETEAHLRNGECANLAKGLVPMEVADETIFPDGAHFRRID